MPLLGELSRSSPDSFEPDSDSNKSRDNRLNSSKSGMFLKMAFSIFRVFSNIESIESIEPIDRSTDRSNRSKAAMILHFWADESIDSLIINDGLTDGQK